MKDKKVKKQPFFGRFFEAKKPQTQATQGIAGWNWWSESSHFGAVRQSDIIDYSASVCRIRDKPRCAVVSSILNEHKTKQDGQKTVLFHWSWWSESN